MAVIIVLIVLLAIVETALMLLASVIFNFQIIQYFFLFVLIVIAAQCGNGECEAELSEDCVSCPLDCHAATCGMIIILCTKLISTILIIYRCLRRWYL